MERIAQYLAAANMGTKLDEGFGTIHQLFVHLQSMVVDLELMAVIHGKLVNHRLTEQAVVPVGGT